MKRVAGLLLAASICSGCIASGYRTKPRVAIVDGDPVVQMAPSVKFRTGSDPRRLPPAAHPHPPGPGDRVLGLAIGGDSLAYPIGLLDRVEVIDDASGDRSWVVARCALTRVAAIYDRSLDGRMLTFENSGALWRDTLVLRDRETGTYWSAATGLALSGPLAGRRLDPVPATYTTADAWRRAFPETRYADLGLPTSVPLAMRLYGASPWEGLSGVKTRDRRFPAKSEFLSVAAGDATLAFTPEEIRRRGAAQATLGGRSITIEWDAARQFPRAWILSTTPRQELAVVPMYWFALSRHFDSVETLPVP
ncbi:MAG: DUF3179 domain-containing (seleno)protein [Acidobacteriota bacterium]